LPGSQYGNLSNAEYLTTQKAGSLRRRPDDVQLIPEPPDANPKTAQIRAIAKQIKSRVSVAKGSDNAGKANN